MTDVVVQRVVFPWGIELPAAMQEVQPLYVSSSEIHRPMNGPGLPPPAMDKFEVTGRRSLSLAPYGRVSFDTYFNRVHAGYLRRWTKVEALTLEIEGSGPARVTLKHSTREGRVIIDHVETTDLKVGFRTVAPLASFISGGAQWFEVEALDEPVEITEAKWLADVDDPVDAIIDIAICTFDRPKDVLALLTTLRADDEFLNHVGNVWLVDNGTKSFLDLDGADAVVESWGARLSIVNQPNLGGSGGFSRGMYEASRKGDADYVFLMDDDVLAEPESLRRALVFAEVAKIPVAVGGQMLLRGKPLELHSTGERVDSRTFRWGPAPLGHESLRADHVPMDWVVDVGYNGWWACLIPLAAVREIGLGQPFFIKWDDAEYGMRLAQNGYRTVSLPGVAVWHESWELKDDTTDWTLYFHLRNRLIAASMLSGGLPAAVGKERIRSIVKDIVLHDTVANITRRAYSSADAANMAMRDFLRGPECLTEPLDELVTRVRAERKRVPGDEPTDPYRPDIQPTQARFQHPRERDKWRALARELGLPKLTLPFSSGSVRRTKKVADEWEIWRTTRDRGAVALNKDQDSWRYMMENPDAVVITADGKKAFIRKRNSPVARDLLRDNLRLALEVVRRGPDLIPAYAAARTPASSPAAWEKQWTR